jgi:hypothetical protein
MDSTKSDFEKRKEEIDEYFSFLKMLDANKVSINGERASQKLQRIFIANTFLLLYNLIESTVRNSILEIYNKIQDDELTYQNLSEKIKKIWLNKKKKILTSSEEEDKSIEKKLESVIQDVINNEIIILTNQDINISGNIDAQEIRNLSKKIGFEQSNNGRDLLSIKEKRNRLAHGEHTFHDVGKNFTYNELKNFKENTFEHLEDVINKIETFIEEKKYAN